MAKIVELTDEAYDYVVDIVGQKQIEHANNGLGHLEEALGVVLEQLDAAVDTNAPSGFRKTKPL